MLGLLAKLWSCSWDGQIFHKDTVIELAYTSLNSASAKFTWHTMSPFVFPLLKYLFHSEEYTADHNHLLRILLGSWI